MIIRMNMTFMPMHVLGFRGCRAALRLMCPGRDGRFWNLAYSIGAFLLAASSALTPRHCDDAELAMLVFALYLTVLASPFFIFWLITLTTSGKLLAALKEKPCTTARPRRWRAQDVDPEIAVLEALFIVAPEWPSTKQRSLTTDDTNVELTTVINRRSFQRLLR